MSSPAPIRATTLYAYDAAGNRLSQTDARGLTVSYGYDALNRLSSISYPTPALNRSFSYDAGAGQKGRLTGLSDASGTTTLGYDVYGNLTGETRLIDGVSQTTGYGYDAADQLASLTYPSGRQLSYSRNVLGRVSAVETTLGGNPLTVASGFTYLPFGPVSGYSLGNGIAISRNYDQQYRLDALTAGSVQDLDYTLDAAGNIDAISDSLSPGHSQSFGQDALHRIEAETGAYGSKGYGYDAVGNRLSRSWDQGAGQTLTYTSDSNRMATRDGSAVVLDAAGNTLDDGTGRTFSYDDTNRMVSASVGGSLAATYSYHASGQRVRKLEAQGAQRKTIFHYGLGGELLGETVYSSAGVKELAREYLWLDALPLAMIETGYDGAGQVTGESIVYLHADHLNTPRLATDATGTVVWRWRSDAFGVGAAETDPDGDLVETVVALRFPGQYYDSETGLRYNYFRDYDPTIGRYTQSDPIGLLGGLNTHSYALNNPIGLFDPYGLWVPPSLPQSVVDAVTGFGDAFLIPELVRKAFDINGGVDPCSASYRGGKVTGFVWGAVPFTARTAAAVGSTRFGHLLNHNRYLRFGPGRMPGGTHVPRASIGRGPGNPHIDLRGGAHAPPIGGPTTSSDCSCQQ